MGSNSFKIAEKSMSRAGQILPESYNSPTYGQLEWQEALAKMIWFMGRDTKGHYEIIIGTDSEAQNGTARPQRLADGKSSMAGEADFVSAVVVHKKGKGGVYFWGRQKILNLHSMKQRIWQEALISLALAEKLVYDFAQMGLLNQPKSSLGAPEDLNLEIHVDIGPNGETRDMIAEIVGMIRANGFKVATKPSSWGASHVADRHV